MNLVEIYEEYLEASATRKLVLFGASINAVINKERYLVNEDIYCLCDNDPKKWGTSFMGIGVVSAEKLAQERNEVVVIITSKYYKEIYAQLKQLEFPYVYSEKILPFKVKHSYSVLCDSYKHITPNFIGHNYNIGNYKGGTAYKENIQIISQNADKIKEVQSFLYDEESRFIYGEYIKKMKYNYVDYMELLDTGNQYFPSDLFTYTDDEVFIDAGCCGAETSFDFAYEVNYKFKKVYAFEPDEIWFKRSVDAFEKNAKMENRYEVYDIGLSNKNGKSRFSPLGSANSHISETGEVEVKVARLDDIVKDKVTFIKMDIEGSELDALNGAQRILKEDSPKLAISIYHKLEDVWEIPLFIKKINPQYKMFIRHHGMSDLDKTLYATV